MQDEFLRLQSMLKKTIIFITHDFDEAIRLADRIAIMYEGGVVQIGAPEFLVLNPRTDYVREFVKNVSRDRIITIGGIMETADVSRMAESSVYARDTLAAAAKKILSADKPLRVVNEDNATVGMVGRERVLAALFNSAP